MPLQNPLGTVGATPAFSPTTEYNVRARYDWQVNDYKMFFSVGAQHVGDMQNEPSSFQSGAGVTVPTTSWLRYDQPAYTTYDASFNVAKDQWYVQAYGTNLEQLRRKPVHDVRAVHQGAGAAAAAGARHQGRIQVLI